LSSSRALSPFTARSGSAIAIIIAVIAALLVVVTPPLAARAAGEVRIEVGTTTPVLAGEATSLRILAANDTGDPWYNLAFTALVPAGVTIADGTGAILGVTPVAYTSADFPSIPNGSTLYVWEDIVDLPAGADYSAEVPLTIAQPAVDDSGSAQTADLAVHPVGDVFDVAATAYASTAPRLLPWFDGSSAVNEAASEAVTVSSVSTSAETDVEAIRVTKTQPEPEAELLRGVHDNTTTYTIRIENTTQGSTTGVAVEDYLDAGLEFVGDGQVDNSDGEEYPGSGPISAPSPVSSPGGQPYRAPLAVETIVADAALAAERGLTQGRVYTKVTWQVDLAPGEVVELPYLAAIPLYENALFAAPVPSPASLDQAANLDNNTGASTRQSDGSTPATDGDVLPNVAVATGAYQGVVRAPATGPADRTASDDDTAEVFAMDVRVLKSADRTSFVAGESVRYTLDIATSEYTDAASIELIDALGDGLCPIVPTGTGIQVGDFDLPALDGSSETRTGAPLSDYPAGCAPDPAAPAVPGLEWVAYDETTGRFFAAFAIDALASEDDIVLAYDAHMRIDYSEQGLGNTSATDSLTNEVVLVADTTPIPPVAQVTGEGTESVADDSRATLTSSPGSISKSVLPRDVPFAAGADPCAVDRSLYAEEAPGFLQGDRVCYELRVEFSPDADSRTPIVTDVLPAGVTVDSADIVGTLFEPGEAPAPMTASQWRVDGDRVVIEPETHVADGVRFVRQGSVLVVHIWGTVGMFSVDPFALDKQENLMKFQQSNVDDAIAFDRSQADIAVRAGLQLVKGVASVDGAPVAGSIGGSGAACDGSAPNCDHIQVREGDRVAYRVDLSGGATSPTDPTLVGSPFAVDDLTVWDRLPDALQQMIDDDPATVTTLNLTAGDGGALLLPGDAGYPADAPADGPALVVWNGIDIAEGATRELTYALTLPEGLLVDTDHVNTAAIIAYDIETNTGDTENIRPDGSLSTEPGNAPGPGTRDVSDVFLPEATLTKTLVSTEVGQSTANLDPTFNTDGVIVQGEHATFRYSLTIPARTTVESGVLTDDGILRITSASGADATTTVVGATTARPATVDPTVWDDFTFDATSGRLDFPASYTNDTDADQVFAVDVTLWVTDRDASNPTRNPNLANNATLVNTARFASESWSASANANVTYREPNLALAKSATPDTDVSTGTPITYTLTVTNANRVKAYDVEIVDTVPAGLIVDPATIGQGGVLTGATAEGGGTITWQLAEVPATANLTYTATINPLTGGGESYVNTAATTGYTLPSTVAGESTTTRRGDRTATASETVTATTAAIDKGVRIGAGAYGPTASAPIGETAQYRVEVTLEADINYYAPTIVDRLPAGVVLDEDSVDGPDETSATGTVQTADWARTYDAGSNTWTWTYDGDILSDDEQRTLVLTYDVLLSDAVADTVAALPNTATFDWATTSGGSTRLSESDGAVVTVLDPALAIAKTVDDADAIDVVPGDDFTYDVTVTNTGNSAAYNMTIVDEVPDGVVVDEDSITDGGVLSGAGGNGGGTITWTYTATGADDLDGPLYPLSSSETPRELVLSYDATLAESGSLHTDGLINVVTPTSWESFPDGGRDYGPGTPADAEVTPSFPFVVPGKSTAAGDTAYVGDAFGWVVTATNTGDAPAQTVEVADVLPVNWEFDETTAITIDGTPVSTGLVPTVTGTPASGQRLVWNFGGSTGAPILAPGSVIEIRYSATPLEGALTDAGDTQPGGTAVPHVNTVELVATDPTGAEGNADGDYAGDDADAEAFLRSADLEVVKTGADAVTAGEGPVTGWTIAVSNNGPDAAQGPIVVEDTTAALPEGVAVTGASGMGWTCDVPARASDGTTTFTCERTDATEALAADASFPDIAVTLVVDGDVDPGTLASDAVSNTAVVTGRTSDPDPDNNTSTDEVPVEASADLRVVKTVTTVDPLAGGAISWQLAPFNDGPSVSQSPTSDRIVITDVVPDGVSGVTVTPSSPWTASTPGGFPADAGDVITFTYESAAMPVGATPTIVVSGTIDPDWPAGTVLTNEAEIDEGPTPDPDPDNNVDDVDVTPGSEAALGIAKTRVVLVGTDWVPAASLDPIPAFEAGDPISYRVTVANQGPSAATGVTIVDEAPTGLTYDTHVSLGGATWTRATGPVTGDQTFTLGGNLAPDADASVVITFTTDPTLQDGVINTALARATNGTNEPTDDDDTDSTRVADLAIDKSHTGEAVAGSTLDYTLTVTNLGPSVSSGPIEIADLLPAGMSYAEDSARVTVNGGSATALEPVIDGSTVTWSIGTSGTDLPVNATIVIVFTADIAADMPAQTDLVNAATVDGPEDPNPSNDRDNDPTDIVTFAEMSVVKDVEAGPWIAGTDVAYTIDVTNDGPSVADARIEDLVPAGLTVTAIAGVGTSGAPWVCDVDTAACEYPGHPVGTTSIAVTARVDASVAQDTQLVNTAELTWTDSRGSHDDDDPATIVVDARADLGLVKTAVDADGNPVTQIVAGEQVRYLLEVTNHGPSDAVGPLEIVDTLPAGLSFVSVAGASDWSCAVSSTDAQQVDCDLPITSLAAGASAEALTLVVGVAPDIAEGPFTNTATVSSQTVEPTPDPTPNTDTAIVDVVQRVALAIVKSHSASAVRVGDPLDFVVSVSSTGPSTATGVTVVESLPAGMEYVGFAAENDAWTEVSVVGDALTGTTVEYLLDGALAAGTSAPALTVTALVQAAAFPSVTNVVEASADQPPLDPGVPVRDDDPVTVPGLSTLQVTKSARAGVWQVGGTGAFAVTVTNVGPTADPGPIVVTDRMPTGMTAKAAGGGVGTTCDVQRDVVTCTIAGGLAVGGSTQIVVDVSLGQGAYPAATNSVAVQSPTEQTSAAVLSASATVDVAADPLANTGSTPALLITAILALLIMCLGVLLVVLRRRRLALE
jgi:fimbrial isopeptide formation D2 family protein/uncharacterized repeat protein (TIGR01451 family)